MYGTDGQMRAQFAQPVQQITLMLLAVALVIAGSFVAYGYVRPVFLANPYLNGVILGVFLVGLLACFWQVAQIIVSVIWIENFLHDQPRYLRRKPPRLLAPLAGMLGESGGRIQLSPTSARSILDSVASRMDESRDIARYLSNLLIFLGLLGTFFGLAITVPAVIDTIRSLAPVQGETGLDVFARLMQGLEAQLGGLGTAFSSSLLGLAGSLVVGLLDLLAGHGQNRFFRELEEWISGITKVGLAPAEIKGVVSESEVLPATFEQFRSMYEQIAQAEAQRAQSIAALAKSVSDLTRRIEQTQDPRRTGSETDPGVIELLKQISKSQSDLAEALAKAAVDFSDVESRMLLRNIDVQLLRIFEENLLAREELTEQIRQEFRNLSSAIQQQTSQGALEALEDRPRHEGNR